MLLAILRLLFLLAMAGIGLLFGRALAPSDEQLAIPQLPLYMMLAFMGAAIVVIGLDVALRRKNISLVSAVFFGLVVGLVVTILLGPVVDITVWIPEKAREPVKVGIAVLTSYLAISLILQTKNDFRFIIPYIEFAKQQKGGRPILLDTSAIIDGRIADVAETRFFDSPLVVPRFVLTELQTVADSTDRLKRNRGRRGLDILNRLQSMAHVDISIQESPVPAQAGDGVDQRLVAMAASVSGRIVTNDFNLNKVAKVSGVEVINLNDLANALKPAFLPGETVEVSVIKPGQEGGQGVGYLEDGTMIVVEDGEKSIGQTVTITVTSVLPTSAGRIIFGRIEPLAEGPNRRRSGGAGAR
ncbi:MAG TPA: TRAM domain-containing protein [Phycisphaerae bacterium]|nr:TRAM domain-containing protein [Phycisphaerae bacterium]